MFLPWPLVTNSDLLQSVEALERHYRAPSQTSRTKVTDRLTPLMRKWLSFSPFFILATCSDDALECSPRGDRPGEAFRVVDEHTIAIPDRRGNNRIDTLRNLVRDPRIGLVFFIPGVDDALRVKGTASISINNSLLQSLIIDDEPAPTTVMLITVLTAHVQNARAIRRAGLWDSSLWQGPGQLPSAAELSADGFPDNKKDSPA